MEEIDYFEGVTNQDFIEYYREDLFSRMEITLYTYPHELADEDPRPSEHFHRCDLILYDYLYQSYESAVIERRIRIKEKMQSNGTLIAEQTEQKIEETAEDKATRRNAEHQLREEKVKAKMLELDPEINRLIDEYLSQVKLIFVDL
jgi:hypothetical protein